MSERTERCETCRFFDDDENDWMPRCLRYPPQINAVRVAEIVRELNRDGEYAASALQCWENPPVDADGWCGEWKPTLD